MGYKMAQLNQESRARFGYRNALLLSVVLLTGLLAFAAMADRFRSYTLDDSYITYRYASNLAAGHGLVFSQGEFPRSEGITSPLYAILISPAALFGTDIVLFSKMLGLITSLLSALITGLIIYKLSRFITELTPVTATVISVCGSLWMLTNPFVVGNALSGMETALSGLAFSTFLLLITTQLVSTSQAERGNTLLLGLTAVLVPMCRPEMGLSVILMLIATITFCRTSRRSLLAAFFIFGFLGTIYYILRYCYYGLPFPLPFYIKQGTNGLPGRTDVGLYLRHVFLLIAPAFLATSFSLGSGLAQKKQGAVLVLALFSAVMIMLGYYCTIHHIVGLGFRFFMPITVGIVVLSFSGIAIIYDVTYRLEFSRIFSLPCLLSFAVSLIISANICAYGQARDIFLGYSRDIQRYTKIGRTMSKASEGKTFRIALNDCGAIPFYSGFPTIDLAGLSNRTIALAQTAEAIHNEIRKKHPHLVVLVSHRAHATNALVGWERISHSDITGLGYEYIGTVDAIKSPNEGWHGYRLLLYAATNELETVQPFLDRLAEAEILEFPE
jgi:hypothetical protein